jgi:hypothetical protein
LTVAVFPAVSVAVPVTVAWSIWWPETAVRVAMSEVMDAPAASVASVAAPPKVKPAGRPVPRVAISATDRPVRPIEPVSVTITRSSTAAPVSTVGSDSTPLPTSCQLAPPSTDTCLSRLIDGVTPT